MNHRTELPIVAIRATRCAECGGPLLTTTCGWNRRINDRARSAARSIQPRLSSGKVKNAATSLRSWRSTPAGPDGRATRDASGNDPSDRPKASRRSNRQKSMNVQRRGHDSTCALTAVSFLTAGAAVRTETVQPSRVRYFVMPAQRRPPTVPSGGNAYVITSSRRASLGVVIE